ncbi:MAG: alpha/beta hydrolase, partial [Spirochaetes bacterium]|nr:alpha/beta hydrolase [Spirochaetota bacterium]
MPLLKVNNADIYYEESGSGPESIVFSHSYLLNHTHFKYQVDALKGMYRCLAYDHRGHGRSEITKDGYDIENLCRDAIGFIEAMKCAPCHYIGLSVGGMIGMMIAVSRPDLLKSLILIDSPVDMGSKIPLFIKNSLLDVPRITGWRALSGAAIVFLFGKNFRRDPKNRDEISYWRDVISSSNISATVKIAKGIAAHKSLADKISGIRISTLVLAGEKDITAGVAQAKKIAGLIPGARLATWVNVSLEVIARLCADWE